MTGVFNAAVIIAYVAKLVWTKYLDVWFSRQVDVCLAYLSPSLASSYSSVETTTKKEERKEVKDEEKSPLLNQKNKKKKKDYDEEKHMSETEEKDEVLLVN